MKFTSCSVCAVQDGMVCVIATDADGNLWELKYRPANDDARGIDWNKLPMPKVYVQPAWVPKAPKAKETK